MEDTQNQDSWYNDIKEAPFDFMTPQGGGASGLTPNTGGGGDQVIQIGSGDTSINMDLTGMWVGNRRFASAPFRMDMGGNLIARILSKDRTLILDENGIASTINFPNSVKVKDEDQLIDSTDWLNVPQLNHTIEGILRPGFLLFFVSVSGYHEDADGRLEFRIVANGEQQGGIFCVNQVADPATPQTISQIALIPTILGINEIAIQARSSTSGDGHITGADINCVSSYLLLGR